MKNKNNKLSEIISEKGWFDIPKTIVTREGKTINLVGEIWELPYSIWKGTTLNFNKIFNKNIRWSLKSYVIDRLMKVSVHAGNSMFNEVYSELLKYQEDFEVTSGYNFKNNLISLIENKISKARSKHRLWALYRSIQWYIYCAKNYSELGFSQLFANELESMIIPGNPKGEAVRMEDPNKGPLHHTLELPLLISALKNDKSNKLRDLQQKAALALSIAFGRNPANLTFLHEEDFIDLTPDASDRCYVIKIPRIKKRQLNPRDDLLDEYIEPLFAKHIIKLIKSNSENRVKILHEGKVLKNPLPLFVNLGGNKSAILSRDFNNSYNMTSEDITLLLKEFVKRHKIISPITNNILNITTRRLRYTLATELAAEGISKRELARVLDHTDTQHVLVYFELAGRIIEHLDSSSAIFLSKYLKYFKGKLIEDNEHALNGDRADKHLYYIDDEIQDGHEEIGVCGDNNICHLDPPFSCYLCPKFQPYINADHSKVLEILLNNRQKRLEKYDNSRLSIQLDDVIMAVSQVVNLCSNGGQDE